MFYSGLQHNFISDKGFLSQPFSTNHWSAFTDSHFSNFTRSVIFFFLYIISDSRTFYSYDRQVNDSSFLLQITRT